MSFFPSATALLARCFRPIVERCAVTVQAVSVFDFGPVFLPDVGGVRQVHLHKFEQGCLKSGLAVSCFGLSLLSRENLTELLDAMHQRSPFLLLADFKVAERNIEVPSCMLMGALRRTAHKGCFAECGGLEGLLYAERQRLRPLQRYSLLGGSLTCVLAESLYC